MSETLDYIKMYARFPLALRRFLKHTLTLEQARCIVRERMEHREENFLRIVEKSIYGYPRSPYLALLKLAGCEMGDLRACVKQKGVEGALRQLRAEGVYVALEEFKGRKPIVRHGQTIRVKASDFANPFASVSHASESGGSTGAPMHSAHDLANTLARAPHFMLTAEAYGILNTPAVIWRGIIPDSTFGFILQRTYMRRTPMRWFSHIGRRDSKHWIKYGLATYYNLLWMRLYGVPVPLPQFVPLERAALVARAVAEIRKRYGACVLHTYVSPALRVSLAATEARLSLDGVTIIGGGEASTTAKVNEIRKTGARFFSNYAMAGTGNIAYGCPHSKDGSDVHFLKDALALITCPHEVEGIGVTVPAFHYTTLLETSPSVLLNLQSDDYGIAEEYACGCELETYGFTTHLREIRSFGKLTGEGVTLIGNEMLHILDQVLPTRFGGSSLDYQLIEEEDTDGFTRVSLIISPRVEIADEQAVIDCVLNSLGESSAMADAARIPWKHANTLRIVRQDPIWTGRGKLMPLHLLKNKSKANFR